MRLLRTVYVPPAIMGPGFVPHVESLVHNKLIGSCSLEHGYITHISNIMILGASVEYTVPDIAVRVSCSVTSVKPYVGGTVRCEIQSQLPQGTMLVASDGNYRVFVPKAPDAEPAAHYGAVTVEIVAVKYDKQAYTCIAKYI